MPARWNGQEWQYDQGALEAAIRAERNRLIAGTDFLLLPDYPLFDQDMERLKVYRQALRDLTQQENFPAAVKWPERPTFVGKHIT